MLLLSVQTVPTDHVRLLSNNRHHWLNSNSLERKDHTVPDGLMMHLLQQRLALPTDQAAVEAAIGLHRRCPYPNAAEARVCDLDEVNWTFDLPS